MSGVDLANDETIINLVKTIEKNRRVRDTLLIECGESVDEVLIEHFNRRIASYRNILQTRLKYLLGDEE